MHIRIAILFVMATADLAVADDSGPPDSPPTRVLGLIGEYGHNPDQAIHYVLEKDGQLHLQAGKSAAIPLKDLGDDHFAFPADGSRAGQTVNFPRRADGRAVGLAIGAEIFYRRPLANENGRTFRIEPVRPVEEIRREIAGLQPPVEPDKPKKPDLVDLVAVVPGIKLDIRYATANNFLGVPLYTSARALMQRPPAEALARVQAKLAPRGYGLLIHDAYRPWRFTKLFWEATPEEQHTFVADPAKGSKHNRGCAVDLTLCDLATGKPIEMTGGYDEFSGRSYPDYPGGTSRQRWHRDLLRRSMEAEGFSVNEAEWVALRLPDLERLPDPRYALRNPAASIAHSRTFWGVATVELGCYNEC